jgi:hypothetical protein
MSNQAVSWVIVIALPVIVTIGFLAGVFPGFAVAFAWTAFLLLGRLQCNIVVRAVSSQKIRLFAFQVVKAFVIGAATKAGEAAAGMGGAAIAGALARDCFITRASPCLAGIYGTENRL